MRRSSPHPSTAGSRGFSLLEMMIVVAIASVLLLATAVMVAQMSQQKANAQRRLGRVAQSFSVMAIMEREWLNAGYHFPAARFAFRTFNNVAVGQQYGGIPVGAPCAGGCIVPGTDVVELVEGSDRPFGRIVNASPGGGDGGTGVTVFLQQPGGPVDFGDTNEYLFLFASENGNSCIGRGTLMAGSVTDFEVTMLDRDLVAVAPDYYSTGSPPPYDFTCPASGMAMTTAVVRRRFMVLEDLNGTIGLYEQTDAALGGDAGMEVIALGVDNLQVTPLARNTDAGWAAGCENGVCRCNQPGADCTYAGANDDTEFSTSAFVVGAEMGVTSRGEIPERLPPGIPPRPRPVLADEALPDDTIVRSAQTQTLLFRNFAQVQP